MQVERSTRPDTPHATVKTPFTLERQHFPNKRKHKKQTNYDYSIIRYTKQQPGLVRNGNCNEAAARQACLREVAV